MLKYAHETIMNASASNSSEISSVDIISPAAGQKIDQKINFLANIQNPEEGIRRIAHVCKKMPSGIVKNI